MAATGTKQQQQPTATPAVAVDPKFEWSEKAGTYVLRLTLPGFRKDDFRVQVDGTGRLTVRGATRPGARGGPGSSLHKVFQLPATASLDDIAGRFEAGVLTLTVPKRAGAAPPTSIEEIKKSEPGVAKEETAKPTPPAEVDGAKKMPREEGAAKPTPLAGVDGAKKMSKEEGAAKSPPPPTSHQLPSKDSGAGKETNGAKQPATRDDGSEKKEAVIGTEPKESTFGKTTRQVAEHVQRMEEDNRRKQIEQKPAPAAKKEEVKPKAPQPTAAAATPEKPAPKQEVATGEKAKAAVDQESLAERVRQRGEEERAKAAAAATAIEAKAEQAKKAVASTCTAWKERIAVELKGLTDMKWADNAVEMARKNKEVVAVGVAAFSLGFLVSQKLFRK